MISEGVRSRHSLGGSLKAEGLGDGWTLVLVKCEWGM